MTGRFKMRLLIAAGMAVAVTAGLGGCKKPPPPLVPAEGVLLLDGEPLPKACLLLVPTYAGYGSDVMAAATTDDKGRFVLECGVGVGACVGTYKVTVTEGAAPRELMRYSPGSEQKLRDHYAGLANRPIPQRFGDVSTTPLSIAVEEGKTVYELKLARR